MLEHVNRQYLEQETPSRKELNDIINSERFKAFEKEKNALKKMKMSTISPRQSPSKTTELSHIKGLKEFIGKDIKRSRINQ